MGHEVRDEVLNHYIFHFNPYTGFWNAFKREQYLDYFNGKLGEGKYLSSKYHEDIVRYIKGLK